MAHLFQNDHSKLEEHVECPTCRAVDTHCCFTEKSATGVDLLFICAMCGEKILNSSMPLSLLQSYEKRFLSRNAKNVTGNSN
jgi:hypothetical protein